MHYVRKLGFEETPDYDFLRELFTKVLKTLGEPEDGTFDWMLLNGGKGWEAGHVSAYHWSEVVMFRTNADRIHTRTGTRERWPPHTTPRTQVAPRPPSLTTTTGLSSAVVADGPRTFTRGSQAESPYYWSRRLARRFKGAYKRATISPEQSAREPAAGRARAGQRDDLSTSVRLRSYSKQFPWHNVRTQLPGATKCPGCDIQWRQHTHCGAEFGGPLRIQQRNAREDQWPWHNRSQWREWLQGRHHGAWHDCL